MKESSQPLSEVFGYLIEDQSAKANRYRSLRLCPFNNKVPNCTKDKAKNPLGVCSIYYQEHPVITCPIRFREEWLITDDAASFFFKEGATWSSLTEVRLNDAHGKTAGNIDVVLVAYDDNGKVYKLDNLLGPGGESKGNPVYEFLGITRPWRYSKVNMQKMYEAGKIIQTKPGTVPMLKRLLEDSKGVPLQSCLLYTSDAADE